MGLKLRWNGVFTTKMSHKAYDLKSLFYLPCSSLKYPKKLISSHGRF